MPEKKKKVQYALRYFKLVEGRPLYFCRMTSLGPSTTDKLEEAALYENTREAAASPALRHALSAFTVVEVMEGKEQ